MTADQSAANKDFSRYVRQMRYSPIGEQGQMSLSSHSAVIVGMGALGAVIAQHLVRGGVGRLRIIDRDIVDWSNLHRQLLYIEEDAKQMLPKAEAAAIRLRAANSQPVIEPVVADVTAANIESLLEGFDLILDGTDNFATRYLINEVSVKHGIPWIYGGAVGGSGMSVSFIPEETPCYRCLFPTPPSPGTADTCETAGVIAPIIDIIGSLQAAEAFKWLTGNRQAMNRSLIQVDAWHNQWLSVNASQSRRDDCPVCSRRQFDLLAHNNEASSVSLCGRETIQITPSSTMQTPLRELARRLSTLTSVGTLELTPYLLRISMKDQLNFVLFPDGRALVQGTNDSIAAMKLYNNLLGS